MIAPLALVIDVHAFLALSAGLHHRAVGLDDRFVEERLGLSTPSLKPRAIEDLLQTIDVRRVKATAEVSRGGRVGNTTRTPRH